MSSTTDPTCCSGPGVAQAQPETASAVEFLLYTHSAAPRRAHVITIHIVDTLHILLNHGILYVMMVIGSSLDDCRLGCRRASSRSRQRRFRLWHRHQWQHRTRSEKNRCFSQTWATWRGQQRAGRSLSGPADSASSRLVFLRLPAFERLACTPTSCGGGSGSCIATGDKGIDVGCDIRRGQQRPGRSLSCPANSDSSRLEHLGG